MPKPTHNPPRDILIVGIVGGIGSGKSAVAHWVAAQDRSIRVFDADVAGHQALSRPEVRERLRSTFGDAILSDNGSVNRSALAKRVFGDSAEARAARSKLESIVHPVIQSARESAIESDRSAGDVKAVLVDAALLLEAGWDNRCDAVVFIDAPEAVRRQRVAGRGWSPEEFARREASQWPLERKKSSADRVIENSRSLDIAGRELYEYIRQTLHSRT